MKEEILLTGCAGFIPSFVADELFALGYKVIGVDNLNDYYDVSLKKYRLDNLKKHEDFTFYEGDIENFDFLKEVFSKHKFKAVLNLAARAGVRYSMENPDVYVSTNMQGCLNILNLMEVFDVKKIVLASTSSLYAGQEMPFVETLPVNTPISPYAASKKAAEVMAYTYHHLYKIDVSILRYFTVYGPAGRPDMSILRFIKWIDEGTPITLYGDGTQSRDFTYVTDIAKATVKAMKPLGYEIMNAGGGNNPYTINYMIEYMEKKLGKKAVINNKPFHSADMKETWANIDKAKKLIDWTPSVSFEQGLDLTIDWYLQNLDLCKKLEL